jgi:FAD synthetase
LPLYAFKIQRIILFARRTKNEELSSNSEERLENAILVRIYIDSLLGEEVENIGHYGKWMKSLILADEKIQLKISQMLANQLIAKEESGRLILLPLGRSRIKVVMAGGTFDIIHPGHLETLEGAKSLGDVLVVSVARNKTVEKMKGKPPANDEVLRQRLVSSIRCVDAALLGSEIDILETVDLVRPDIIALGYDQHHSEASMVEGCIKRGLKVEIVRLSSKNPAIKTSFILGSQDRSRLLTDL